MDSWNEAVVVAAISISAIYAGLHAKSWSLGSSVGAGLCAICLTIKYVST